MLSDVELLIRLGIATLCAGLVGWERESLGKPAGLRTHILVAVGAVLAVGVGDGLADRFEAYGERLRFDPMRIIEAVMVGLGFIGAGTIITRHGNAPVSGLTTAAGLWATGAIGLAVATGRYVLAGGATLLVFIILRLLAWVESRGIKPPPGDEDPPS